MDKTSPTSQNLYIIDLENPKPKDLPILARVLTNGDAHWHPNGIYPIQYRNMSLEVSFHPHQHIYIRRSKDPEKPVRYDVYLSPADNEQISSRMGSQGICFDSPCRYYFQSYKLKFKSFSQYKQRLVKFKPCPDNPVNYIEWLISENKEYKLAAKIDRKFPKYGLHVKHTAVDKYGMYMSMRKIDADNLLQVWHRDINGVDPLPMAVRLLMAINIVRAVLICVISGVLHRDIKMENILVDVESGRAWLCDYGLAMAINKQDKRRVGSPAYLALELWQNGQVICTEKTDLYSLGRVLYLLFRGDPSSYRIPENATHAEINEIIQNIKYESLFSGISSTELNKTARSSILKMIKGLLNPIPDYRPSATQCLNILTDVFFDQYPSMKPNRVIQFPPPLKEKSVKQIKHHKSLQLSNPSLPEEDSEKPAVRKLSCPPPKTIGCNPLKSIETKSTFSNPLGFVKRTLMQLTGNGCSKQIKMSEVTAKKDTVEMPEALTALKQVSFAEDAKTMFHSPKPSASETSLSKRPPLRATNKQRRSAEMKQSPLSFGIFRSFAAHLKKRRSGKNSAAGSPNASRHFH